MADKRGDLSKIQGMGNGVTTQELQRRTILDALAEELATKKPLLDGVLALIDEDEQKIAELERILESSDTSITITADVDEAVTGFKRLQRELRETTKKARELESACKDVEDAFKITKPIAEKCGVTDRELLTSLVVQLDGKEVGEAVAPDEIDVSTKDSEMSYYDLSEVPTKELHEELAKREGVEEFVIAPHGEYANLRIDRGMHGNTELIEGPARILVNKD